MFIFNCLAVCFHIFSVASQSDPTNSVEELFEYANDYSDFDKKLYEVSEEDKLKINQKLLEKLDNGVPMNVIQRPMKSKI